MVLSQQPIIEKRRKILILPQFQLRYIRRSFLSTFLTLCVFFFSNQYFFFKFHSKGKALSLPGDHAFFAYLNEQKTEMNAIFVLSALAVFTIHFIYGLYMSHKIAGPIFRLEKYLRTWLSGNHLEKVVFRKEDNFSELAEVINQCLTEKSSPGSSETKSQ